MKRLIGAMAVLFVVSVVAAPFVQAADGDEDGRWGRRDQGARGAWSAERPRNAAPEDRGDQADGRRHPGQAIGRLLLVAASAPWAKDDAELQGLVDEAVRDRKALYEAEGDRMKAFDIVLKGLRKGKTREELEDEIAALKTAAEKFREAADTLREDIRAIHERMKELRPERDGNENAAGMRPRRNRGGNEGLDDDLPPEIY